jgi:hypothetical protein
VDRSQRSVWGRRVIMPLQIVAILTMSDSLKYYYLTIKLGFTSIALIWDSRF